MGISFYCGQTVVFISVIIFFNGLNEKKFGIPIKNKYSYHHIFPKEMQSSPDSYWFRNLISKLCIYNKFVLKQSEASTFSQKEINTIE
ncbi:MAG: hypothetical protein ABJA79_09710 [Parafilimonas sp.]